MSPDRLIYMANQIGKFFQFQGHDKAVPGIAEHIRKFWDPRMRATISAHLDTGGAEGRQREIAWIIFPSLAAGELTAFHDQ